MTDQEKLDLYFSIDWLRLSRFLLESCQYDGWGWELLYASVKNDRPGAALAHLFRKFNLNFQEPDVTIEIENINKAYEIFSVIHTIKDGNNILAVKTYIEDSVLLDFFESIDIERMSIFFKYGIRTKLLHKQLVEKLILKKDRYKFLKITNFYLSRL